MKLYNLSYLARINLAISIKNIEVALVGSSKCSNKICQLYVGISAILKSVAPKGIKVIGVSLLLVDTGEVGGASAALCDSPQSTNLPYEKSKIK